MKAKQRRRKEGQAKGQRAKARSGRPPSMAEIERGLIEEWSAIVDRLGPDHPRLGQRFQKYVAELEERHPEWMPVMRRNFRRRMGRDLDAPRKRRLERELRTPRKRVLVKPGFLTRAEGE